MSCFAIFHNAKQLRVFSYEINSFRDRERAKRLAHEFADKSHAAGYPCEVEEFGMSGVGCTVYRTKKD